MELWGGLECTINRVADQYFDQLTFSGHYQRPEDIDCIASLGVKAMRYPILWERHQPILNQKIDWSFAEDAINSLLKNNIEPIIGLVHHGSGPNYSNFFDESFEIGLANYAMEVAQKFPFIEYYTPINEPLTTARFCGLYGLWYPHGTNDYAFLKVLISECKATVMAMAEIRKINPNAKLVQTEDLGKTYSTPLLQYQADFENERRWLAFDLLCGKVNPQHKLWNYIIKNGIDEGDLYYFLNHSCPPDIFGFNYYITSERFIDEQLEHYPSHTFGGNDKHFYADVEAIRVNFNAPYGFKHLVNEAWKRYQKKIAITEVHLHCSREEQMRWFHEIWNCSRELESEGVDIVAVTAWAILGSFGWNTLLTAPPGDYEPGVYDVRSDIPRPMALAKLLESISKNEEYNHPLLNIKGWWKRNIRFKYFHEPMENSTEKFLENVRPVLIIGQTGTLGKAFAKICQIRGIHYHLLNRQQMDICDIKQIKKQIEHFNPWAIINASGYVRVDEAEYDLENCYNSNAYGPLQLAECCAQANIKFLTFSSDLVFDGSKEEGYHENDVTAPLNIYGCSKALGESHVLSCHPDSLVIRTSAFFGPWDKHNFVSNVLNQIIYDQEIEVVENITISPTYVPDLVHAALDLLTDGERGLWHITNSGETTWTDFAYHIAQVSGFEKDLIKPTPIEKLNLPAFRPRNSVLKSIKGITLPHWKNALDRYFAEQIIHPEMHILI